MRTFVFRFLAGLLAVLFGWFLTMGHHADLSLRKLVAFWAICLLFGIFALFGPASAERFLGIFTGKPNPDPPSKGKDDSDKDLA
jgi:hypothetical protein